MLRASGSRWMVSASLLALLCCGCGEKVKGRPQMAKVNGKVSYQGNPVEGAMVTFLMEDAPRPATGVTDAEGNFKLTTFDTFDGAIIGTHKVVITKADPATGAPAGETKPEDLGKIVGDGKFKEFMQQAKKPGGLPIKYADAKTTPLQYTIDAGENTKEIELED